MSDKKVEPIVAAGGLVFRYPLIESEPEVLMIYRNGYWDLPKGKLEEGESIPMCAAREVAEETGSYLPAICTDLGTSYHEYEEKGKIMGKTTYWYSMIYTRPDTLSPQGEEGIEELKWVTYSKAIQMIGFDNLKQVFQKFKP